MDVRYSKLFHNTRTLWKALINTVCPVFRIPELIEYVCFFYFSLPRCPWGHPSDSMSYKIEAELATHYDSLYMV